MKVTNNRFIESQMNHFIFYKAKIQRSVIKCCRSIRRRVERAKPWAHVTNRCCLMVHALHDSCSPCLYLLLIRHYFQQNGALCGHTARGHNYTCSKNSFGVFQRTYDIFSGIIFMPLMLDRNLPGWNGSLPLGFLQVLELDQEQAFLDIEDWLFNH